MNIAQRLAKTHYHFDEADAWLDLWCHSATVYEGTASGNGQGYGEDLCGEVFGRNGCPPGKELPILGNAA